MFDVPVYPRWRGEHVWDLDGTVINSGLSPLARGTHTIAHVRHAGCRFIPAGAGNTTLISVSPSVNSGLSPLARGTLNHKDYEAWKLRFIPAGAGNTADCSGGWRMLPVYPRWRGEHRNEWHVYRLTHGLSPLARGTRNI